MSTIQVNDVIRSFSYIHKKDISSGFLGTGHASCKTFFFVRITDGIFVRLYIKDIYPINIGVDNNNLQSFLKEMMNINENILWINKIDLFLLSKRFRMRINALKTNEQIINIIPKEHINKKMADLFFRLPHAKNKRRLTKNTYVSISFIKDIKINKGKYIDLFKKTIFDDTFIIRAFSSFIREYTKISSIIPNALFKQYNDVERKTNKNSEEKKKEEITEECTEESTEEPTTPVEIINTTNHKKESAQKIETLQLSANVLTRDNMKITCEMYIGILSKKSLSKINVTTTFIPSALSLTFSFYKVKRRPSCIRKYSIFSNAIHTKLSRTDSCVNWRNESISCIQNTINNYISHSSNKHKKIDDTMSPLLAIRSDDLIRSGLCRNLEEGMRSVASIFVIERVKSSFIRKGYTKTQQYEKDIDVMFDMLFPKIERKDLTFLRRMSKSCRKNTSLKSSISDIIGKIRNKIIIKSDYETDEGYGNILCTIEKAVSYMNIFSDLPLNERRNIARLMFEKESYNQDRERCLRKKRSISSLYYSKKMLNRSGSIKKMKSVHNTDILSQFESSCSEDYFSSPSSSMDDTHSRLNEDVFCTYQEQGCSSSSESMSFDLFYDSMNNLSNSNNNEEQEIKKVNDNINDDNSDVDDNDDGGCDNTQSYKDFERKRKLEEKIYEQYLKYVPKFSVNAICRDASSFRTESGSNSFVTIEHGSYKNRPYVNFEAFENYFMIDRCNTESVYQLPKESFRLIPVWLFPFVMEENGGDLFSRIIPRERDAPNDSISSFFMDIIDKSLHEEDIEATHFVRNISGDSGSSISSFFRNMNDKDVNIDPEDMLYLSKDALNITKVFEYKGLIVSTINMCKTVVKFKRKLKNIIDSSTKDQSHMNRIIEEMQARIIKLESLVKIKDKET